MSIRRNERRNQNGTIQNLRQHIRRHHPVGEKLTAEQWLDRYQWGRYTKMIVGGGIINGSVALVFDDEVERYRKAGCDFSSCTTDEDYLAAIEAFEDNPPVADAGVSDQTRIADALEDMVALSLPDAE